MLTEEFWNRQLELIKTVITDAIKILGPAIIAAFATYKVSKAQYELKLKELEKNHEFGARDKFFNYYKERKKELENSYDELSVSFGKTLGLNIGVAGAADDFTMKIFESTSSTVRMYSKFVYHEIRGKYAKQYHAGTNLVLLDPDIAKAFPTDKAVNEALRQLIKIAKA